jgi:hypothetical protein
MSRPVYSSGPPIAAAMSALVALQLRHVDVGEVRGERRVGEDPLVELLDGRRDRVGATDLVVDRHGRAPCSWW